MWVPLKSHLGKDAYVVFIENVWMKTPLKGNSESSEVPKDDLWETLQHGDVRTPTPLRSLKK